MEKARQAISNFVSQDGKHKTTVDETVRNAVTEEHVLPTKHEQITTAVDKEVHQDHHHTTVQPLKAREVLPEQHSHNIIPVEHKTFHHGNDKDVRATLDQDAAKYKNATTKHDTTHSASVAPTVSGERIHHHVHEHVQPVIQKETIAPQVVHTTVPVHEVHHATAQHHGTSVLPAKTLEEFTGSGGMLDGRGTTKLGEFDRCPKPYNENMQTERLDADKNMHLHSGGVSEQHNHGANGLKNGGGHPNGSSTQHTGAAGGHTGSATQYAGVTGAHAGKPSLINKLNPFKDADGDGKKGFMD